MELEQMFNQLPDEKKAYLSRLLEAQNSSAQKVNAGGTMQQKANQTAMVSPR